MVRATIATLCFKRPTQQYTLWFAGGGMLLTDGW
jgi:hypothetical protein